MKSLICLFLGLFMCIMAGCSGAASTNPVGLSIDLATANNIDALNELKAVDINIIELHNIHSIIRDDEKFAAMQATIEQAGLQVHSLHYPYGPRFDPSNLDEEVRLGALKEIEFYLGRLRQLGGTYLIVHPSFEPVPAEQRQARLQACRKSILELNEIMADYPGLVIAMENLPRTCLGNTAAELNSLIAETDPQRIGICLDTNHMLEEDLLSFTAETIQRIVTVHISDYDFVDEKHWFPGQGVIDWHKWAQMMREGDYQGPMLYEVTWPIARGKALTARQMAALVKLNYEDYFNGK